MLTIFSICIILYLNLDPCAAVAPTNGAVTETAPAHGADTIYSCDAGYSLVGTATQTCTAGTLSDTPPSCSGGILANDYTVGQDNV